LHSSGLANLTVKPFKHGSESHSEPGVSCYSAENLRIMFPPEYMCMCVGNLCEIKQLWTL
jgi:hypothetical protein